MTPDLRDDKAPVTPPRLALRPRDAARALGIGERKLWEWTNRKLIPHIKCGKAVLYPVAALEAWLLEHAGKGGKP